MSSSLPDPIKEFLSVTLMYESVDMYMAIPRNTADFPVADSHHHKGYEFILPLTDMPFIEISGRNICGSKNHMIPINPQQEHGVSAKMENVRFVDILFDESYFENLVSNAFNTEDFNFENDIYPISMNLYTVIRMFIQEYVLNLPARSTTLKNLSAQIATLIYRETKMKAHTFQWGEPFNADTLKIKKIVEYIHLNYIKECSIKELADIVGISRYHLIRIFKDYTGKTPYDYFLDIKLEKAKALLASEDILITAICHECGFNNISHFNRIFKARTGVTPSTYRTFIRFEQ